MRIIQLLDRRGEFLPGGGGCGTYGIGGRKAMNDGRKTATSWTVSQRRLLSDGAHRRENRQ